MALVAAGMPWDIAEKLKPWQLLGFQIIAGELKGGVWDWQSMRWRDRR
jgi:hypothetical protein